MSSNDPTSRDPAPVQRELQTAPAPSRQITPNVSGAPGTPQSGAPQQGFATSQPGQAPPPPLSPHAPTPGYVRSTLPLQPGQPGYAPPSRPLPGYAPPRMPQPGFAAPPQMYPPPSLPQGVPIPQPYLTQQGVTQAQGVIRDYDLGDRIDGWADTVEDAGDRANDVLRIFLNDAPGRLNFPAVRMLASDLGVTGLDALAKGINNPFLPAYYGAIIGRGFNALLRSWFGFLMVLGVPVALFLFATSLFSSAPIAAALILFTTLLLITFLPLLVMAVPFVFTRSTIGERRLYQFAVTLPGASIAVAVKRTGRDLYLSWDLFVRRLWNEAVLGIILLMSAIPSLLIALALSAISSQPVTVPSTNPLASPTSTPASPLGGFLVLLSVLVAGTIILAITYSIVLIIAGLIFKRDPLGFFLKEPTLFEYHDISAMTISVDKALRQAADQAGIQVALRPKEQYQVGPRQRLI